MKKVINITIGQMVFFIEEDAYEKLENYLSSIREYFSSAEGGDDVLNDIEYSIAEKFTARGMDSNKSISIKDVDEIIEEMGTIEELTEGEKEPQSSDNKDKNKYKNLKNKRLYRDTEDIVIAGVASGIAQYFNIDPVIVRILFVISIFFGGFGIISYLILWFVVPPADTASKKIDMEGGNVTLSEIEIFVKKKIEEVPKSKLKKFFSVPFKIIKKLFQFLKFIILKFGLFLIIFVGVIMAFSAVISLFAFSASLVTFLSGGSLSEPGITAIINILPQGFWGIVFMVGFYLSIVIPLVALAFLGIRLIRRKRVINGLHAAILFVVWFISFTIITGISLTYINEIQAEIKSIQKEIRDSYQEYIYEDLFFDSIEVGGRSEVKIVKGDTHKVVIEGSKRTLEALRVDDTNGVLDIDRANQIDICLLFCQDFYSPIIITITTPEVKEISFSGSVLGEMEEFKTEEFDAIFSGSTNFIINAISESLNIKTSGSGVITLIGEGKNISFNSSGSSKLNAYDFISDNALIKTSGSSRIQLNIKESLNVNSSGSTDVMYINSGNVVVTKHISGSGTVQEYIMDNKAEE